MTRVMRVVEPHSWVVEDVLLRREEMAIVTDDPFVVAALPYLQARRPALRIDTEGGRRFERAYDRSEAASWDGWDAFE